MQDYFQLREHEVAIFRGVMTNLVAGRPLRRRLTVTLAMAAIAGCASARGTSADLPPYVFTIAAAPDSAMQVVRGVLESERVAVEPDAVEGARTLRGSFVVRRGGLGETEVFVTGRVSAAGDTTGASSRIELDVSVRERRRSIVMAPADVRTGGSRPDVSTVNPNDRETIGVLTRIRDRLANAGAVRVSGGNPP